MEWASFLATTARLLDLHDCDRTPGAAVYTPTERRPGTETGLWLDVGTRLLQYLYDRDLESNEAWVPVDTIMEELAQRHGITREDVLFVANYLATPTRLITAKEDDPGQRQTLKRETALIEWPSNTNRRDRCRLSPTGVKAVLLSQAAQSWLYAADDASKLERAIEYGAYVDVPQLAEGLVAQIRRFSKEITLLLERRHMEELLADFAAHRDDYLEVIKGVQRTVEAASERFSNKQVMEHYSKWLETDAASSFTPYTIIQSFTEIMQAIERLNRKFQTLVSALASTRRDVIGLIRFDEAAVALAFHPCSEAITDLCISTLGPWSADITAPSPVDFSGILSLGQQEHSTVTLVFDDVAAKELPTPIQRFLDAYRDEILAALKEGPVSLGEAVQRGWLAVGDFDVLPQLVGVYITPSWLDRPNNNLAVSMVPGALDIPLPDGGRLEGDDLVLHWLSPAAVGDEE